MSRKFIRLTAAAAVAVSLFTSVADAQKTVSGKVLDAKTQEALVGASVVLLDNKTAAITDFDGQFSFVAEEIPVSFKINYLGYQAQEIDVYDASEPLTVYLNEDVNILNEVVVVGYGTQKRKELTGAVASLSLKTLEQPSTTIDALLGGAVAGVNVTHVSGQPGEGSQIRIRGGNSVYANNEPLYVIDGFIYYSEKGSTQAGVSGIESSLNPIASINPADIESIEILKDASAKAIYGSRGANGVILVTTKKGSRGKNTIHYNYTLGIDKSAKKLDLLNAEQFKLVDRDLMHNNTPWTAEFENFYNTQSAAIGKNIDTDWHDAVLRTAVKQTHEISFGGGDDKTRYLLSGNYTNQEGIVINTGFERYSGRINLDREISKRLTVGISANADRSVQNSLNTLTAEDYGAASSSPFKSGITNSLVYALFMPPVLPVSLANGQYNYYNPFEVSELNYYGTAANPVADLEDMTGQTVSTSLLGNFYAKYDIPYINGLTAKFSAGTNVNYITQNFFAPPNTVLGINTDIRGRAAIGNRRTDVSQTEYLLTYTKQLNDLHYIDLLGGYTYQKTATGYERTNVTGIEKFDDIGFSNVTSRDVRSKSKNASLHSLLSRVNYTFAGKYNFTATFRADESSRFADRYKWGYFPSAGISWNASDETFLQDAKTVLSTLKIRATFGTTGNQEIGFDDFATDIAPGRYGNETAAIVSNVGNSNLKWETTTEYNLGLDAGLLNDRINLTADIYYKLTYDLLLQKFVPMENLYQVFNVGNVENKGFEISINTNIIQRKRLNWSVNINFAKNINTFTKGYENNGKYIAMPDNTVQILKVGEPVGAFYGYIYDGVNPADGSIVRRDIDGDGEITSGGDRTIIGSIQPDFTYGFSSSLTWKRCDLFASLQGSQGNEVYNALRRHLTEGNYGRNRTVEVLDAWTPQNTGSNIPALNKNNVSPNELYSRYVEDGSFLKLRNLTLGYTLPLSIDAQNRAMLRLFVSGQNLFTITKYKGYDPEVANGIDTGIYPTARTFLFGAGISF
ncbi:MAG: TonB-dependent receptor [Dysgonamonadaceae bacterium]|jgi:TonB-linked SusC/RagA family outer membrane protein|nr:TonB-dependent receptor [Dysgonamonadaceae bacterium]